MAKGSSLHKNMRAQHAKMREELAAECGRLKNDPAFADDASEPKRTQIERLQTWAEGENNNVYDLATAFKSVFEQMRDATNDPAQQAALNNAITSVNNTVPQPPPAIDPEKTKKLVLAREAFQNSAEDFYNIAKDNPTATSDPRLVRPMQIVKRFAKDDQPLRADDHDEVTNAMMQIHHVVNKQDPKAGKQLDQILYKGDKEKNTRSALDQHKYYRAAYNEATSPDREKDYPHTMTVTDRDLKAVELEINPEEGSAVSKPKMFNTEAIHEALVESVHRTKDFDTVDLKPPINKEAMKRGFWDCTELWMLVETLRERSRVTQSMKTLFDMDRDPGQSKGSNPEKHGDLYDLKNSGLFDNLSKSQQKQITDAQSAYNERRREHRNDMGVDATRDTAPKVNAKITQQQLADSLHITQTNAADAAAMQQDRAAGNRPGQVGANNQPAQPVTPVGGRSPRGGGGGGA